jgi:hypothetical protein
MQLEAATVEEYINWKMRYGKASVSRKCSIQIDW